MSRGASAALIGLVASLPACTNGEVFVPFDDSGASAFVLTTREGPDSPWKILAGGMSQSPLAQVGPDHETILLLFDETPEELGLVAALEPRCRARHPRVSLVLAESDTGWGWLALEAPPEDVIAALIGNPYRCDPCAPLLTTAIISREDGRFTGAAWFDETSALVVGQTGFSRVTETTIEPLPNCEGLIELPFALAAAGEGRFWVGGVGSELALLRFSSDGASCVVETSTLAPAWTGDPPRVSNFAALAPRPEHPETHDLIALRATGEVLRWDAEGLHLLGRQVDHPVEAEHQFDSIVRLDDERTIVTHGWNQVQVFDGNTLMRVEEIPLPPSAVSARRRDRITTLAQDTERDLVLLGSSYGDIWARPVNASVWTKIFQSALVDDVGSIFPSYSRYLFFHGGGDVAFLHYEEGECPNLERLSQSGRSAAHRVLLERNGLIMIADVIGSGDRPAGVAWIREPWAPAP